MRIIKEHIQAQRKTNKMIMLRSKNRMGNRVTDLKGITTVMLFLALTGTISFQNVHASQDRDSSFTALAQQMIVDKSEEVMAISMEIKDMSLYEALETFTEEIGVGLSYSSDIALDKKVSLRMSDVPFHEVLYALLEGTNLEPVLPPTKDVLVIREKEVETLNVFQETISGVVTDAQSGEALPGVNIVVQGTTTGTSTNVDGVYELSVPALNITMVISYIGYETREVPIEGRNEVNIELQPISITGDEMVVIGYGIVRRSDLTGSVSSIQQNNFRDSPSQRAEQLLQGRASGVEVTNQSGAPGGDIRIRVRGINSITGVNEPLFIVDGIASKEQFNHLNVDDIESIEVLKDASATAIYGSRGANGVILVTTKQGIEGETQINFETQHSWGRVTNLPEMLSAPDFARFYNEFRRAQGTTTDFYSQQQISEWEETGGVNYIDMMFETGQTQNYKLNVSGGSDRIRYYISGDVLNSEGVLVNSNFQRLGFRGSVNADVSDRLAINLNVTGNRRFDFNNLTRGGGGSPIRVASIYAPTIPLFNEDGDWDRDNVSSLATNPYGERVQSINNNDITHFVSGSFKADYDLPVDGLIVSVVAGTDYRNRERNTLSSMERNLNSQNSASGQNSSWFNWQITNQLNYSNQWGHHGLSAMIAAEFIREEFNNSSMSINNLLTETVSFRNLSLGSINNFGNSYTASSISSYLSRVNYNLMDKYLFTGTLRYDGSSRFQGDNKWGYFPSFAVAWNINNERFINDLNIFDEFRVRTSWGVSGTQSIPPFSTLGLLGQQNYGYGTSTPIAGFTATDFSSPDLTWERTFQWNVGTDLGFFDYRLLVSSNFFYKQTKDLLLNVPLPLYTGGGTVLQNVGQVDNKGYEMDVTVFPVRKSNVQWESILNISYVQNEVVDLGGEQRIFPGGRFGGDNTFNMAVLEVGSPMGSIWGFEWLGIWSTDEASEAAVFGQQPGDNKFLDKNNDDALNSEDHGIIGKAFPDYIFGWNNVITWNNFSLNIFLQGAVGAQRLNVTRQGMSSIISEARFVTSNEAYDNMWTPENQDTDIPNHFSGTTRSIIESSQWLENADYIRLKNLSLGYTFAPFSGSSPSVTVTASAENLLTITGYSGLDPEVSSNTGNPDTNAGIEFGGYPNSRTINFGVSIYF